MELYIYLMLKHVVPHKQTFGEFIRTQYPMDDAAPYLLTDAYWYVDENFFLFLELFYDSTIALFGIDYPTSPLMLHHLNEIDGTKIF